MPAAALPSDLSTSHDLLHALLEVSLPGIILFQPVYAADDPATVLDLAYVHLNPAAQQMLRLPAQPSETFRTLYPNSRETGIFAFYRDTFLSGQSGEYAINYPFDGLDNFFLLTARRCGELLVVGFTDTAAQERSQVEQALRESQAREQAARAEAEVQRKRFYEVLMQLPAQVATYHGPDHVFSFVNQRFSAFVSSQDLLGRPVREAARGAVGQEVFALLDRVYATGESVQLPELEVVLDHHDASPTAGPLFVTAAYLPLRDGEGRIYGVLDFSYDVTEQVLARRQVEQLNRELEARVQARTREVEAARATTERQRRQWEELFRTAPAGICIFDGPEWVYQFVNPDYQALFPGRQLLGKRLVDALPEVADQPLMAILHRVYDTGEPFQANEVLVPLARTEGGPIEDIYFDLTYLVRRDEAGQIDGFVTYAYDATERVLARRQIEQVNQELEARVQARTREVQAAQAATERERALLQALFAQAPVAIGLLQGEDLRVASVNALMATLWGHTPEQLVGQPLLDGVPELRGQGFDDLLRQVLTTQVPVTGTETPATMLRDGELKTTYYNFVYQPLYNAEGQVLGVIDMAVEVTEQVVARRQVEQLNQTLESRVQERTQQLAEQQAELRRLFAQAPVAIAVFRGPRYVIELANPAVCTLWGRTMAQTLGTPLFELLPEAAGQGFEELLDGVMATGVPFVAHELPAFIDRDGQRDTVYWNFVYQPLREADDRITAITVVATDVSEQVRTRQQVQDLNQELAAINEELVATNEELNESNTQLTRTNVDLDTFVYTASHDLKAPITNIEAILLALRAQLPAEVQQDELVAQLLEMLQGTVGRFQLTITQLTDVAKLQLAHTGAAEPVLVAQMVESVRQDLGPQLEQAATQLTVEVAPELEVSFSPANLRSVVYNLLSNAVKYRSPARPSWVLVRAAPAPQATVLTVQDNGLGMSELQQRQLFGLFQRLHTHVEGTGVGLYIVKRLVENGGGAITVQSQPNVGTTFTVTIPHSRG